uniref:Uncharacterized protein n=1 Tax=Trichogramma kaykai TaxID=54128 RepID=A0ABD2VWW6_9HYME
MSLWSTSTGCNQPTGKGDQQQKQQQKLEKQQQQSQQQQHTQQQGIGALAATNLQARIPVHASTPPLYSHAHLYGPSGHCFHKRNHTCHQVLIVHLQLCSYTPSLLLLHFTFFYTFL